jgi:hypothetical protein
VGEQRISKSQVLASSLVVRQVAEATSTSSWIADSQYFVRQSQDKLEIVRIEEKSFDLEIARAISPTQLVDRLRQDNCGKT